MSVLDVEMSFSLRTPNGHTVVPGWRLAETIINILETKQVESLNELSIELFKVVLPQKPVTPEPITWKRKEGKE